MAFPIKYTPLKVGEGEANIGDIYNPLYDIEFARIELFDELNKPIPSRLFFMHLFIVNVLFDE